MAGTDIRPREMETTTTITALWSTGRIMCAVGLGAAILAATASSAGAYTAGSADYGQVINQLQQVNANQTVQESDLASADSNLTAINQTLGLLDSSPTYQFIPSHGGGSAQSAGSQIFPNYPMWTLAGELGPLVEASTYIPVPSYLESNPGMSIMAFSNNVPGFGNSIGQQQSVFNWVPSSTSSDPYTPDASVFVDAGNNSVFQSPNGNSYLSWYPNNDQNVALGSTTANWKTAANTSNIPYSIFRTNTGGSVFENMLGQGDFSATEVDTTGLNVRNSAFVTPSGNSVFMAQAYALATGTGYGTHESDGTTPTASQSVFVAGTGAYSGIGSTGTGSVFVTDDPQNKNVGNSVFLDPYGNSYLDDISADLSIPTGNMFSSTTNRMTLGPTPQWTYSTIGTLIFGAQGTSRNNNTGVTSLAELVAAALGTVPTYTLINGSYSATTFGASYPYLSAEAMQIPEGMTNTTWYNSQATTGWSNSFAYAFFNPPSGATAPVGLVPYLSALGGWTNSTTFQNSLTTNQTNDTNGLNTAIGTLDTTFTGIAPSNIPGTGTQNAAIQGGWSANWILPMNTLSTAVGTLTDANPATQGTNGGFVQDNNSNNVVGAIQDLTGRIQQLAGYTPPSDLLAYTNTTLTTQYTGDGGDTANGTSNAYATMDAIDDGEFAFLAGAVSGMQWFRGSFGWLASFFGFWFLMFTIWKAWELIYWGINGGRFPLLFNTHNRTPGTANYAGTSTANIRPDLTAQQDGSDVS